MDLPEPGDRIERYTVLALLGEGGTARVYRVRHEVLGTEHALKVLLVGNPGLVDRFLQEGRVQARLRHGHLVAVTDVLEHQGRPCLVQELVLGVSLQELLEARGRLPAAELLPLMRPVIDAVQYAHSQGVLHRDLKPANILLEGDPAHRARVTDFGLAKVRAEHARTGHTRDQAGMGTPGYAAPEQWADAAGVDARADVWSLCAVLYTCMAGRTPVDPATVQGLRALLDGDIPPLQGLAPDCPEALARVIHQGLAALPQDRWPSAAALGEALDLATRPAPPTRLSEAPTLLSEPPTRLSEPPSEQPAPPEPPPPAPSPGPTLVAAQAPASPRPWASLLLLGGTLALALGVGLLLLLFPRPPPPAPADPAPDARAAAPAVIEIPALRFVRGDVWGDGLADERPAEVMELAAFGIDRTELRTSVYQACVDQGACSPPAWATSPAGYAGLTGPDQPIVGVTWTQASQACAWRSGRLPTEWEWEAAATWSRSSRVAQDKRRWPWGEAAPDCARAQHQACSPATTREVDSLPDGASAFGLLHMTGNVWEWTSSRYPMRRRIFRRPQTHYVLRGGAHDSAVEWMRPTFRRHTDPSDARPNQGFRCAWNRPSEAPSD